MPGAFQIMQPDFFRKVLLWLALDEVYYPVMG